MGQDISLKFYVYAPSYNPNSGGVIALHKLAHNLFSLGEKTFIVTEEKNPNWLGVKHNPNVSIPKDGVAIYPEIISGNPFNTNKVVRWLLNTPGVLAGDGIYKESDLVFKYADYFKAPDESKVRGLLTAYDLQLDKLKPTGVRVPGSVCAVVRKGHYKKLDRHPENTLFIDDYDKKGNLDYLIKVFGEYEYFISYDHSNFMVCQAALCGCIPIVIPDGETCAEDWMNKFPFFKYGIAYGEENIGWAKKTQHLVKGHLLKLEVDSYFQAKNFINECYKSFA